MSFCFDTKCLACFNSMIVRLKDYNNYKCDYAHYSFNSMIVRLKERSQYKYTNLIPKFQFYDSPIKSIKYLRSNHPIVCFNSMIVRLKVFQGVRESVPPFFGFNSMIVRLKAVRNDKKHY